MVPQVVGIDGAGGTGKSTLAAAVAERLKTDVAIVPMDDFIVRDRMLNDSCEHGWDRERLIRQVLDPLRRGNASATSGSSGNQTR